MAQGTGLADSLTRHIALMVGQNAPQWRLTPLGFINLLKTNSNANVVKLNDPAAPGHRRTVIIKAKQRLTAAHTDTTASCDQVNRVPFHEHTIALTGFRQLAIQLEDETVALYPAEASNAASIGNPSTTVLNDLRDSVMSGANALLTAVNQDLLTLAAGQIGTNVRTGNNATSTVNVPLNSTNNPLDGSFTQILQDYQNNEAIGTPMMVGSGLPHNYFLQQAAKSPDQSGLNTSIQSNGFQFFFDPHMLTAFGANQCVAYEPEAIQMVEYMRYQGFKAGAKGTSVFFTIMLPMQVDARIKMVPFDAQLLYNDCPVTVTDAYYGTSLAIDKGWTLILSKDFDLFTVQADAYRATDRMTGNRGSYRYTLTNT